MNNMYYENNNEKRGFRFWFIIASLGVLGIIISITAGVMINSGINTNKYNTLLAAGNKYYNAGDYQNAIIEYEKAIKYDDTKEGAYLNMSAAYVAMEDYTSAVNILNIALGKIDSAVIKEKLIVVNSLLETSDNIETAVELTEDEINELSKDITVENSIFNMVASNTYTEYYRDFGEASSRNKKEGTVSLFYESIDFTTVYYDLKDEKVLNSSGDMPIAAAKPCQVHFNNIKGIFNTDKEGFAVSRNKLIELFGPECVFEKNEDNIFYMTVEYKNCKFTVETDKAGNIISQNADNTLEPLNRTNKFEEEGKKGKISGYIKNAMTGAGISADINLREYGDRNGEIIDTVRSDEADGEYYYEGNAGKYTAEISAEGYTTEYVDIEIYEGQIYAAENIVLSPKVGYGEIRIVLTWGAYPTDLDSHVDGISATGTPFSINYASKDVVNIGNLDLDDVSSYGPETITIVDSGSVFDYSVVDFTNSNNMSLSGAVVKVYVSEQTEPYSFSIPVGTGNTWTVFHYENGTVTPIDTIQ